jgi:hypothetical protein
MDIMFKDYIYITKYLGIFESSSNLHEKVKIKVGFGSRHYYLSKDTPHTKNVYESLKYMLINNYHPKFFRTY